MYASTNTSINIVICSYMNMNSTKRREKSSYAQRPSEQAPKKEHRRSDRQSAERKR